MPRFKDDDERNFRTLVRDHFRTLRERFNSECHRRSIPIDQRRISTGQGSAIFDEVLSRFQEQTRRAKRNPSLAGITKTRVFNKYKRTLKKSFDTEFSRYLPTQLREREINNAIIDALLSNK